MTGLGDGRRRFAAVFAAALLVGAPQTATAGGRSHILFRFQDPRIDESSAIVDAGRNVLTINDSGDGPRVFVVDKLTGRTVGVTTYAAAEPVDVEAIAPGRDHSLWVGDIGDNDAQRSHVTLYRIPWPVPGDRVVGASSYDLVFADGARDAETLLVSPRTGRVYVVSKGLFGGTVYAAPRRLRPDRTNVLVPVGSAPGLVTDGLFFPDGRHLLLRDYSSAYVLRTAGFKTVGDFELPAQEQGEGVGLTTTDRLLLSTEGEHAPVDRVAIPGRIIESLRPLSPGPRKTSSPVGPAADTPQNDHDSWSGYVAPLVLGVAFLMLLGGLVRARLGRHRV